MEFETANATHRMNKPSRQRVEQSVIDEIQSHHRQGVSIDALMAEYNLPKQTIHRIVGVKRSRPMNIEAIAEWFDQHGMNR